MNQKCFDLLANLLCLLRKSVCLNEKRRERESDKLLWILNAGLISFQILFSLECNAPYSSFSSQINNYLLNFIYKKVNSTKRLINSKVIKKRKFVLARKEWNIKNIYLVCWFFSVNCVQLWYLQLKKKKVWQMKISRGNRDIEFPNKFYDGGVTYKSKLQNRQLTSEIEWKNWKDHLLKSYNFGWTKIGVMS